MKASTLAMSKIDQNSCLAREVVEALIGLGVREVCFCPGSRNSPFFDFLDSFSKSYFWPEERSAAFFALGRARATSAPVAVITTSGSAAGELLPAMMEAHYTQDRLIAVTADRPRRFRGTGAPQSVEQKALFGVYASYHFDIAFGEEVVLPDTPLQGPIHFNVCFEEPQTRLKEGAPSVIPSIGEEREGVEQCSLEQFYVRAEYPLVIVSALPEEAREPVIKFLVELNAPVYLEATSLLREELRLRHLRIMRTEQILEQSQRCAYPIDAILRIGGVPTLRLWRDLEEKRGKITLCSISETGFSGLSWAGVNQQSLASFFSSHVPKRRYRSENFLVWRAADRTYQQRLYDLFVTEPFAEASLVHRLSLIIPRESLVFLGNSLPIREWDLAAGEKDRSLAIKASRGVNGIDGQISTFLGMSRKEVENWAIIGDLTALYDLAAPWIVSQLEERRLNIVVINNSGGRIFSRLYSDQRFINEHQITFKPLAELWGMQYERWTEIGDPYLAKTPYCRLIEIIPDNDASERFWKKLTTL